MRLLINLEALKDCFYDLKYYHKAQGFIYSLMKDEPYSELHNKKGYKFFCFSNIMPPENISKGSRRTFIVSSPDKTLIAILEEKLKVLKDENKNINIGEMFFRISDFETLDIKIGRSCSVISGTPIVIRIPKERFAEYGIEKKYNYAYWKPEHPFEAFIKQLTENIYKKYEEFYKTKTEREPLFQQFIFKKSVCNHVVIDGIERKVFGSLWQFIFNYLDNKQRDILKFAFDVGFGELNSMGFGFMNLVK